jgi:hypothetical protein
METRDFSFNVNSIQRFYFNLLAYFPNIFQYQESHFVTVFFFDSQLFNILE